MSKSQILRTLPRIEPRELLIERNQVSPDEYVFATYWVKFDKKQSFLDYIARMVIETSIGPSGLDRQQMHEDVLDNKYLGRIISPLPQPIETELFQSGHITVAYHIDACGVEEGIPMILSTLWYISVYEFIQGFRLEDVEFPPKFLEKFNGPRYGIKGLRALFKVENRALLGLVLKPNHGVPPDYYAAQAYKACVGGVDYVTDYELLVDPPDCRFGDRVEAVSKAVRKASKIVKKPKFYIPNITTGLDKISKLYKIAKDNGAGGVQINALTVGFTVVQEIRRSQDNDLPLFLSKIGRGIITRGPDFGVSPAFLCQITRMIGGDAIYTGAVSGWISWKRDELIRTCRKLQTPWSGFEPSFSISSGGMNLNNMFENIKVHGNDLMIQMGTSLASFEDKIESAAKRTLQVIELIKPKMTIEEFDEALKRKFTHDQDLADMLKFFKWHPSMSIKEIG